MEIHTSRFGTVDVEPDAIICFPLGIPGWEQCHRWVLLADGRGEGLAWLQSMEQPEVALAVVSPRRFVPDYEVRVGRRALAPLELDEATRAEVLVIVARTEHALTLNLKAPLLINPQRGLGCEVVVRADVPMRYELGAAPSALRRIA